MLTISSVERNVKLTLNCFVLFLSSMCVAKKKKKNPNKQPTAKLLLFFNLPAFNLITYESIKHFVLVSVRMDMIDKLCSFENGLTKQTNPFVSDETHLIIMVRIMISDYIRFKQHINHYFWFSFDCIINWMRLFFFFLLIVTNTIHNSHKSIKNGYIIMMCVFWFF